MRMIPAAAIGVIFASYGLAQLDSYTVTVTTSRSLGVAPDQTAFSVYVDASMTAGLSDVVAAVGSLGITTSNLSNVRTITATSPKAADKLEWTFTLAAPIGSMEKTITAIQNLAQTIGKTSGMDLSFDVVGTQVSAALQNAQVCPVTHLMLDARRQAQALGDAAGFGVGKVLAVSDGSVPVTTGVVVADPVAFLYVRASQYFSQVHTSPNCSITVKFQLMGS